MFYIDGPIETVSDFRYLGVIFNYTGTFIKCRNTIADHARKALFFVLKKVQEHCLDIDVAFQLFDSMVSSILTFGSEIWGYENLAHIERVHLMFCKYVLKLKRSTPSVMVYGELGRFPMEISIKVKMVKFWGNLIVKNTSYSGKMYRVLYGRYQTGSRTKWLSFVREILENCGFGDIWLSQTFPNVQYLGEIVKRRLQDQFIQKWHSDVWNSAKSTTYRALKQEWGQEKYLISLPSNLRIPICRLKCSNHKLPIEVGRYTNIPREERLCTICHQNTLGDEYHLVLECPFFVDLRRKFIPSFFYTRPSMFKLGMLFNSNARTMKKLSLFISKCNSYF